jgi:cytochrome c oxidase subunit IV
MAQHEQHIEGEIAKPNTAWIWRVFWILLIVTAIEFIIALALPLPASIKNFLYIFLTIVKAGYIVGEFMHLRHEVKFLFWSILLPMIFIVWLLIILIAEGGSVFELKSLFRYK